MKKVLSLILAFTLIFVATSINNVNIVNAESSETKIGNVLSVDYDNSNAIILGGSNFTIKANTESAVFSVLDEKVLTLISQDKGVAVFSPKSAGMTIVKVEGADGGLFIYVPVINAVEQSGDAKSKIEASAFTHEGEDMTVVFSAGGYDKFYNFVGTWSITHESGEIVEFTAEQNKAVIKNAKLGVYTITLSSISVGKITTEIEVNNVNSNTIWTVVLPVCAIIMIVLLIIIIVSKKRGGIVEKQKRAIDKMENVIKKINDKLQNENDFSRELFVKALIDIKVAVRSGYGDIQILSLEHFGAVSTIKSIYENAVKCVNSAISYSGFDMISAKKFVIVYKEKFIDKLQASIPALIEELGAPQTKPALSDVDKLNLNFEDKKKDKTHANKNAEIIENLISSVEDDN